MTKLRWWLFKQISRFGWWVCPEPHRSRLQMETLTWRLYQMALDNEPADPSNPVRLAP